MVIETSKSFGEYLGKCREYLNLAGWTIDRDIGVYKETDEEKKTIASPIPIFPSAIMQNQDNGTEKIELTFYKRKEWRSIVVDRNTIANKNKIITLANQGVEVNSQTASRLVSYLSDVISASINTLPFRISKSVMGWVDNYTSFAPYEDNLVFDGEREFGELFDSLSSSCTLEEWIDYVAPLRKDIPLRLLMAASFASPLIELVGENPFVFLLHGKTGTAKTVALMVAASIWGNPSLGKLVRTMNMTNNAMLSQSAFLNNLPMFGDELQTIKTKYSNYDNLIMQITEGVDRGRMTFDKLNETKSWKCAYLFTGEEPCTKSNSGGGVKNRCLELELKNATVDNGNEVSNFVKTHYGVAGQHYIKEIIARGQERVISDYRTMFGYISSLTNTTDKQAGALALVLIGDIIARETFFPNEEPLKAEDYIDLLKSDDEVDPSVRAYDFLIDTISRYGENFGEYARDKWGKLVKDYEGNTTEVYLNKTVMEKILTDNGFDFGALRKSWKKRGYILLNSQGKYYHQTTVAGQKTNCIRLKIAIKE